MTTTATPTDLPPTPSGADLEERWYRAVVSRDPRFDGWILVGVTSTGIYCRPSCPTAVRPKRANVTFHRTAAAAQRAGFRACKRCRPDAVPGSPAWDVRGDLVGRAMRLIADGVLDREDVRGLARRLAVSERHLHRVLVEEVGAGPLAIARAGRAQTARTLIETTGLPFGEVAFAAGFSSIRQFNDTVREVFASTPTELRRTASSHRGNGHGRLHPAGAATLGVRLPTRAPFDGPGLLHWFHARAIDGVEHVEPDDHRYARALSLPGGPATVDLRVHDDHVVATFRLTTVADLATAVTRVRRILDLDADPGVVAEALDPDPTLRRLLRATPGLRVPGAASGAVAALLTIVGQQVSVAAAARTCSTITGRWGRELDASLSPPRSATGEDEAEARRDADGAPSPTLTRVPLTADDLAEVDPADLPMPRQRATALIAVCRAMASGELDLEAGGDRDRAHADLLAIPGVGPWTADYLRLRSLGDPDVMMHTDLIVRRKAAALGLPDDLAAWAKPFAPWRSYVSHHLWAAPAAPRSTPGNEKTP